MTNPASYTIDGAAAVSGIPAFFLTRAIQDGRLKAHDAGGTPIIAHADLKAFIDALPPANMIVDGRRISAEEEAARRKRGREIAQAALTGATKDPRFERGRQIAAHLLGKKG